MAKLTKADVLHVARLAKVNLTEGEVGKYLGQLSKVVAYVGELQEVDTSAVLPTSQTTGLENVYRNDEVYQRETFSQEKALSGSENVKNGYFKVRAILPQKGSK